MSSAKTTDRQLPDTTLATRIGVSRFSALLLVRVLEQRMNGALHQRIEVFVESLRSLRMFVQGDVLTEDWSDASAAWQP